MTASLRIGIIGDFNPEFHTHLAIGEAFGHAAGRLDLEVEARWLPTPSVSEEALARFDGLWLTPGSPYRSMEGALRAIRFARERDWPFAGT